MRTSLIFLLITYTSGFSLAQTRSDSLYFTNLYPLENNQMLLIGSETAGSFRKCVIRLYDDNMNIRKQQYERNMRNSKVFLDGVYGNYSRIISRYRWNKGRVFLYEDNLILNSVRFFKRDDYKDWIKTEDEPFDYPLMRNENLLNLNPVLFNNQYCYYFAKEMRELFVYTYDVSFIKPSYTKVNSYVLKEMGQIETYKLIEKNEKVYLYYQIKQQNQVKSFLSIIDREGEGQIQTVEIIDKQYNLHISDLAVSDDNKLVIGGSYQLKSNNVDSLRYIQDGWFVKIFDLESMNNLIAENFVQKKESDAHSRCASKLSKIDIDATGIQLLFETIKMNRKEVNLKDGIGLSGDYYSYETTSIDIVQYNWKEKQFRSRSFGLKFNLENDDKLKDKQWRTFHHNKGQTIFNLCFNGNNTYGYNDMSVAYINFQQAFLVYADRNYNYYKCEWSGEELKYKLISRNQEKARCYFYDNFFVKYYQNGGGFKLEKQNY